MYGEMHVLFGGQTLLDRRDTPIYFDLVQSVDLIADFSPNVYTAGAYADNDVADTFTLTRSGNNLVLTVKEGTTTRSTDYILATAGGEFQIKGSTDFDSFVIYDLGDFTGIVNVVGVETAATEFVQIYDTSGDDVWDARDAYGSFQMEDAYRVTVTDVPVMHGYASGGNDHAYLSGNSGANKVKLYDTGINIARIYLAGVYSRAKFFESVDIYGNGGSDTAILYNTANDDDFTGTKDEGQFTSSGIDYSYFSFETATVYGGLGTGTDTDNAEFNDSELADEVIAIPNRVTVEENGSGDIYLTIRKYDYFYATALTDDDESDIIKMKGNGAIATIDLLTAAMESGNVRAKYYYNPANYNSPSPSEIIYESLGFETTKGYAFSSGTDKKDTDGVSVSLLAWYGSWEEI